MLTDRERAFLLDQRIGRLATADRHGAPHVVPVGFAILRDTLYISIDEKPKRAAGMRLKRVRNILENAATAFVADRYDEDWSRLGWVMLRGQAEILEAGAEHDAAQAALTVRYRQYASMPIAHHPVIALRIARVASWGDLSVAD
jgi:PPOX class probable F420-dependent enzyme